MRHWCIRNRRALRRQASYRAARLADPARRSATTPGSRSPIGNSHLVEATFGIGQARRAQGFLLLQRRGHWSTSRVSRTARTMRLQDGDDPAGLGALNVSQCTSSIWPQTAIAPVCSSNNFQPRAMRVQGRTGAAQPLGHGGDLPGAPVPTLIRCARGIVAAVLATLSAEPLQAEAAGAHQRRKPCLLPFP